MWAALTGAWTFFKATFVALPQIWSLIKALYEDCKELILQIKNERFEAKVEEASQKANSGDTSGYEDIFRGKK